MAKEERGTAPAREAGRQPLPGELDHAQVAAVGAIELGPWPDFDYVAPKDMQSQRQMPD